MDKGSLMKSLTVALALAGAAGALISCNPSPSIETAADSNGKTSEDVSSGRSGEQKEYSEKDLAFQLMGWSMGQQMGLHADFTEEEIEQIMIGIENLARGQPRPENSETLMPLARKIMEERMQQFQRKQPTGTSGKAAENKAKGREFLTTLEGKEGFRKTESGLYYEVTETGSEGRAKQRDKVTVHYRGTLIDGTVFDSSFKRGQPATFSLGGVIAGFSEGLQLVGEGGKIKLYIPSDLGYGDNPRPGGRIPPGATLIFEIELIKIISAGN